MHDFLPVTQRAADRRDAALLQQTDDRINRFKVETVERLEEMRRLQDEMQSLIMQAMGAIRITNTLQPDAEGVEVRYFVERQGMRHETSQEIANEATALRGQVSWRETSILERYEPNPAKMAEAEQVVAQLRKLIGS